MRFLPTTMYRMAPMVAAAVTWIGLVVPAFAGDVTLQAGPVNH